MDMGRGEERVRCMETMTWKIDTQQEFGVWLRKLKQRLCINLEGLEREMGGSFKGEGIYAYLWLIHGKV